jgi:hypothetical protein
LVGQTFPRFFSKPVSEDVVLCDAPARTLATRRSRDVKSSALTRAERLWRATPPAADCGQQPREEGGETPHTPGPGAAIDPPGQLATPQAAPGASYSQPRACLRASEHRTRPRPPRGVPSRSDGTPAKAGHRPRRALEHERRGPPRGPARTPLTQGLQQPAPESRNDPESMPTPKQCCNSAPRCRTGGAPGTPPKAADDRAFPALRRAAVTPQTVSLVHNRISSPRLRLISHAQGLAAPPQRRHPHNPQ